MFITRTKGSCIMSEWKEINIEDLDKSACRLIGKDWMLVTAAKDGKANTMTASWDVSTEWSIAWFRAISWYGIRRKWGGVQDFL